MLEPLLRILQRLRFPEQVEMSQYAEDVTGHAGGGEDVEELHGLHLEAVIAVDHEQDDIGDLGDVDHGLELVGTFDKGQPLLLRGDDGDGTFWVGYRFLGISADQGL